MRYIVLFVIAGGLNMLLSSLSLPKGSSGNVPAEVILSVFVGVIAAGLLRVCFPRRNDCRDDD
ncbi:MAG: hypothetical protein KGH68_03570 [Patescibacteria group bacterium]|nr:hypothetical protein [Patescibacteria group bacterium]